MLRYPLLILFLWILLVPDVAAQEIQEQFQQVLQEIDRVENQTSSDIQILTKNLELIDRRLSKLSTNLNEIPAIRENIDDKYKKILQVEANLEAFKVRIDEISTTFASLETKISELEKDQTRTESDIRSSQDIITYVTLSVTVIVIVIGLFFSKHFLDLYSNYKVLNALAGKNQSRMTSEENPLPNSKRS